MCKQILIIHLVRQNVIRQRISKVRCLCCLRTGGVWVQEMLANDPPVPSRQPTTVDRCSHSPTHLPTHLPTHQLRSQGLNSTSMRSVNPSVDELISARPIHVYIQPSTRCNVANAPCNQSGPLGTRPRQSPWLCAHTNCRYPGGIRVRAHYRILIRSNHGHAWSTRELPR